MLTCPSAEFFLACVFCGLEIFLQPLDCDAPAAVRRLWIESGYNPKQIQKLMGHSSIKVTFDVYGHLFADNDADQRAADDVQTKLLGA